MKKLKRYIDKRGIKYAFFAKEALGMNPTFLCEILKGNECMPIKYWRKIMDFTGGEIVVEDFLEDYEMKKGIYEK
jgi:hypothetical protein